jgi:hypothetical protein
MADYGIYVDNMLILIFGGIPWQVYFQRVLSAKSEKSAMYLSYVAAIGCLLSGIPPAIIGMIGKAAGKTINIILMTLFVDFGHLLFIKFTDFFSYTLIYG